MPRFPLYLCIDLRGIASTNLCPLYTQQHIGNLPKHCSRPGRRCCLGKTFESRHRDSKNRPHIQCSTRGCIHRDSQHWSPSNRSRCSSDTRDKHHRYRQTCNDAAGMQRTPPPHRVPCRARTHRPCAPHSKPCPPSRACRRPSPRRV